MSCRTKFEVAQKGPSETSGIPQLRTIGEVSSLVKYGDVLFVLYYVAINAPMVVQI